jgi:hypothetical protein
MLVECNFCPYHDSFLVLYPSTAAALGQALLAPIGGRPAGQVSLSANCTKMTPASDYDVGTHSPPTGPWLQNMQDHEFSSAACPGGSASVRCQRQHARPSRGLASVSFVSLRNDLPGTPADRKVRFDGPILGKRPAQKHATSSGSGLPDDISSGGRRADGKEEREEKKAIITRVRRFR